MAKAVVLAVFDAAMEAYLAPIFVPTRAVAVRMFQATCQNKESQFAKNPEHFFLRELADFDDHSGEFVNKAPVHVAAATDFMEV